MQFETIGVVGCGLMGHGIAQVAAAQAKKQVVVVETVPDALAKGLARIEQSLTRLAQKAVDKGQLAGDAAPKLVADARRRIHGVLELDALRDCDLVIEAVVEDLEQKNELWRRLARICREDAVFASNTSSFPIASMAAASGRPERTIGLHFFNPVQLMQLVEVVRTDATEPAVHAAAVAFGKACGKEPVTCRDTPGFIVNRLLVPYLVQALLMVERGDATADDVDVAMRLGCGHPMGPITLADYVGLDTTLAILQGWGARYPDEPAFVVPQSLRAKVAAGEYGRKSGRGFFTWSGDKRV